MARITVDELRQLVRAGTSWQKQGWEPPDRVLDIVLKQSTMDGEPFMHSELAGQTLSFEGREVTVNLDFDNQGYLVAIEFV